MRGNTPRQLYCKKCERSLRRDAGAVLNIEKKATLQDGAVRPDAQ